MWQFRKQWQFPAPVGPSMLPFLEPGAQSLLDGALMMPSFPSPAVRTPSEAESSATARGGTNSGLCGAPAVTFRRARCMAWRIVSTRTMTRARTQPPPRTRSALRATAAGAGAPCPRPAGPGLRSPRSHRHAWLQPPARMKCSPYSLELRSLWQLRSVVFASEWRLPGRRASRSRASQPLGTELNQLCVDRGFGRLRSAASPGLARVPPPQRPRSFRPNRARVYRGEGGRCTEESQGMSAGLTEKRNN